MRAAANDARAPFMAKPLHQTYELYLTSKDGGTHFEPLTLAPGEDVREIVGRRFDDDLNAIEVRRAGMHLFSLRRSRDG